MARDIFKKDCGDMVAKWWREGKDGTNRTKRTNGANGTNGGSGAKGKAKG
jgi:hypothetical protein